MWCDGKENLSTSKGLLSNDKKTTSCNCLLWNQHVETWIILLEVQTFKRRKQQTPKFKKPKLFICCLLFSESFSFIAPLFLFYNVFFYLWIWRVNFPAFSIFNHLLMAFCPVAIIEPFIFSSGLRRVPHFRCSKGDRWVNYSHIIGD